MQRVATDTDWGRRISYSRAVRVSGLLEPEMLVEIEATALLYE